MASSQTPQAPQPADRPRFLCGLAARLADRAGLALITTLVLVTLVASIIAAGMVGAIAVMRIANSDYRESRAFYAAEAAAEAALAEVEAALRDGLIEDAELLAIAPPDLNGFDFTGFSVIKDGPVISETITDGPWAGLYSLTQNLAITSPAADPADNYNVILLNAKAQAIPLFQFGVFFEGDLEDYAGSEKHMYGRVHANGSLFINGKGPLYFHQMLTTPNKFHRDGRGGPQPPTTGIWVDDEVPNPVNILFDSDDTPDPEQFKLKSEDQVDSRLQTDAFAVDSLRLPLPLGMSPREVIRPKELGDSPAERSTKFAWKADMYVTIDLENIGSRKLVCGGTDDTKHPEITIERPFGGTIPTDAEKCAIFDWRWEAFYDHSELRWTDVLDANIAELQSWFNLDPPNNSTEIIYIAVIPPTETTNPPDTEPHSRTEGAGGDGDGYFPVLRVISGAQLPGPLTVGSELPLFILGDYNSINWQPSAVFGDKLTLLSNSWSDAPSSSRNPKKPPASDTRQFFAVVTGTGEGYISCYYADPTCTPDPIGGGSGWVKMLENWNSCPGRCDHEMKGSFISLWAPHIATPYGSYPGSNYYNRPERDWGFDTRFLLPENLPPGTPVVGQVFRAAFKQGS